MSNSEGVVDICLFVSASRQRVMLETASIASGATIAVFLVVVVCAFVYIHYQRRQKQNRATR